jgi:endonuclease/exonuclease/phosphatase family metal-dependent hydrolase
MFERVGDNVRRRATRIAMGVAGAMVTMAIGGTATAQTVVLNQPAPQVTDTTIRAGAYAHTNYDTQPLVTRSSTDPDWLRRGLLKFDTQNTIPAGARISSATLTLTVRSGLGSAGQTRPIHILRVTQAFQEAEATWIRRQGSTNWSNAGGDFEGPYAEAFPSNTAGSRVSFNVTSLVQRTVNGEFGSRYTRMMLADVGAGVKESYREYYASEDSTASRRPTLTVVLSGGTTTSPAPSTPSTGSTLKVLHWNIAQGHDPTGEANITRIANFIASKRPDVISLNEAMRYSSTDSHHQQIAARLQALTGQTWTCVWVQKSGASTGEGEVIMTRLGVDATDDYLLSYARSVAMLRVNVNGRNITVASTHLDHQSTSYRLTQISQLRSWLGSHPEQRIVAGDFNAWPGTTEYSTMTGTYNDGWAVARSAGTAYAPSNNPDGNTRNSRIDYVFASKGATALRVVRADVYDASDSQGRMSDHQPLMVTYSVQ